MCQPLLMVVLGMVFGGRGALVPALLATMHVRMNACVWRVPTFGLGE